jgi:hypothetical protein
MRRILQGFVKKMQVNNIPCFIYLIKDKNNEIKFIEVIVKRPYRYTEPQIIKKIPKTWRGIKVKVL